MTFRTGIASPTAFDERHKFLSTSPDSNFAKMVTAQRKVPEHATFLRGCVMTKVHDSGTAVSVHAQRSDWFDMLQAEFGLALNDLSAESKDHLWHRVSATHTSWERSHPDGPPKP